MSAPRLLTRQLYSPVYSTCVHTAATDTAPELLDLFLLRTTQIQIKNRAHRQIGEAEAFYKLLPGLLLNNSNVSCHWLPLGKKDDRYIRMNWVEDDSKEDKNSVKLEGVEGLWHEQPDILSIYKRRDDQLEKICYTYYGKMIRSGGKTSAELKKAGSTGSMLPEHPRLFLGTHETRTDLNGVLIVALYPFKPFSLLKWLHL